MKEERQMLAKLEVKNWYVNLEDGESLLFYCDQPNIGPNTIRKFVENVLEKGVIEVYHVPQEELQYYCIDERVWVDTPEKAEKLREKACA